ncbi:MAG: AarF/UbiB family protein [Polyangiaceae bacterium]
MHVIATAGHVDHGKSALIRALTGMEPDRWAEERRRGMTIDLGFAWTTLPSGEEVAFVDVPGHERFTTNMLAGVGPVPAALLVVAADGGWSAQTVEHVAALDALGVDKKDVARRIVRLFCQMIFVDGVYHADPHPGNVLVQRSGAIVLLDFGAVAELSPQMRQGIPEFLEGVLRRDTDRLIKSMRKMGFISRTSDEGVAEKIIEYFHRRFQEEVRLDSFNLKDIRIDPQRGLENLLDLRRMNIGLRELSGAFHVPKDWVLLERTILLLYGCCALLDPELNPVAIIQPYLQDFVLGNRDFTQIAIEAVRDMAMSAVTLPEDMRRYLTKANRGELEVRVRGLPDAARAIYAAGRQIVYTSIGLFAGAEALDSWHRHEPAMARDLAIVAGISALLLLLSSVVSRPRR